MAEEKKVDLMRTYPLPQSTQDMHRCFFLGWTVFTVCAIGVFALTLYFGG